MDLFHKFISDHNKNYKDQTEHYKRFTIFTNNLKKAQDLNDAEGNSIYGITKFMDLTPEEFRAGKLMPKGKIQGQDKAKNYKKFENLPQAVPESYDWRDRNAVTPVYDQGQCGSCWAFSATEAIESQWFLAGHSLDSLSPQQIVDCDQGRGDEGCNGGDTTTAYQYIMAAGGQETMQAYPYTGEDGTCAFSKPKIDASIQSWTYITQNKNETEMVEKLYTLGPLSICVDATSWQYYVGGIVEHLCGTSLDHCVMITGYGQKTDWLGYNVPIWYIRNSWGSDWGEDGYIWVMRNEDLCGVADEVTIPLIKKTYS